MPIYEYRCKDKSCFKIQDAWNKVAERHNTPSCECGEETELQISASRSNPDIEAFQCIGFDHDTVEDGVRSPSHFRSRKHMNDELKARGLSIANPRTRVI